MQLDWYGYAAFGLSVFPYMLMLFINLIVLGIVGQYPCVSTLRTDVLDEAKRCEGSKISGEIGTLQYYQ